jgi:hypothetical protein
METIEDVLKAYGKDYVDDLRGALASAGRNASGSTSESIVFDVTRTSVGDYNLKVEANSSILALEFGRNPTSSSGNGEVRRKIEQWINARGIQGEARNGKPAPSKDALVFMITRKIHRDGFAGTAGLLTDVINDESTMDALLEDLSEVALQNVFEVIDDNIKSTYDIG